MQNLKPLSFSVFLFAQAREFTKTQSIESKRVVLGPENILFAGVSVHLSTRKFYRLGSEGVKARSLNHKSTTGSQSGHKTVNSKRNRVKD